MEQVNIQEVLQTLIEPLLEVKAALLIKRMDKEEDLDNEVQNYIICLDDKDFFRFVLGKGAGCNAIRDILFNVGRNYNKKINVKFENLKEE